MNSFCYVVAMSGLVHDVDTVYGLMLIANSVWKYFLKYDWCPGNWKLQFSGHHSYFRKYFELLLAVKKGKI